MKASIKQTQKTISNQNLQKAIIFDSGSLISFSMNGITDMIGDLKSVFKGKFLITNEVKEEIIDNPLKIRNFKLEAMKIKELLDSGILEMSTSIGISDAEISKRREEYLNAANTLFHGKDRDIHLIDIGEASCLALSKILTEKGVNNVIAMDERTTRSLVERPDGLRGFLEKKLHVRLNVNRKNLEYFKGFKIIRSTELVYVAYKKGLVKIKNHGNVLDALLYAMKSKGAAISGDEIEEIKRME